MTTPSPRAAITTLGCKLNQYESEQIREQLARLGYDIVAFEDVADVYVVNSCTVTGRSDRDCRRLARKAKRQNPEATVVMAGCYAEVSPEELREIPEIDLVLGNEDKVRLHELLPQAAALGAVGLLGSVGLPTPACDLPHYSAGAMVTEFARHTRAFVKVQEGCDAACTYCVIPKARGASRSVPLDDVLEQCRRLAAAGHPEVVLIGTHLGRYGQDLPDTPDLAGLCRRLCAEPSVRRLRLSSIEPREITPELIALAAASGRALTSAGGRALSGEGKLCRHLHIPLQSGCDTVLRRMARPYDTGFYADLIRAIHAAEPSICIGADVMVGFPGETDDEFEQTRALLAGLPLAYLHVFTYSRRPGTPAAEMPDEVGYETKIARNHILRDLSQAKRATFAQENVGRELEVVVETGSAATPAGHRTGVSDNYLQVQFPGDENLVGELVTVAITASAEGGVWGELVG